jgi:hypothetical protein
VQGQEKPWYKNWKVWLAILLLLLLLGGLGLGLGVGGWTQGLKGAARTTAAQL